MVLPHVLGRNDVRTVAHSFVSFLRREQSILPTRINLPLIDDRLANLSPGVKRKLLGIR